LIGGDGGDVTVDVTGAVFDADVQPVPALGQVAGYVREVRIRCLEGRAKVGQGDLPCVGLGRIGNIVNVYLLVVRHGCITIRVRQLGGVVNAVLKVVRRAFFSRRLVTNAGNRVVKGSLDNKGGVLTDKRSNIAQYAHPVRIIGRSLPYG